MFALFCKAAVNVDIRVWIDLKDIESIRSFPQIDPEIPLTPHDGAGSPAQLFNFPATLRRYPFFDDRYDLLVIDAFGAPFGIEAAVCAGAEVFPVLHARCRHELKGLHPHKSSAVFKSVEIFFHNDAMGEEP